MAKLVCPKCKSAMVQMGVIGENYKTKTKLDLNPLHPFTLTKTETKKKKSAAKLGLGLMTGGMSLLATGTKKDGTQYHCMNCGHVWTGK